MKPLLFASFALLPVLAATAQTEAPKGRPVAAELQLFKDKGAVIVSSDKELVALAKEYIDFGQIYLPTEVDTANFKGLYICEYTSAGGVSRGYTYGNSWASQGSDYYLVSTTEAILPGSKVRALNASGASVGVPVSNTLREKMPLYMIVFNNLLHLSYRADKDISVDPADPSMETAIGDKIKQLQKLKLLVMDHELHKSLSASPDKIGKVYPYPYEKGDLFSVIRAVKEKQEGKAAMFITSSQAFWGFYVLRCDTHELLYGWSKRISGHELTEKDFAMLAAAVGK